MSPWKDVENTMDSIINLLRCAEAQCRPPLEETVSLRKCASAWANTRWHNMMVYTLCGMWHAKRN